MFEELSTTFLLNFFAELGDKTQILTMVLAVRNGVFPTLTGVFLSALILQVVAVGLGSSASFLFQNKIILNSLAGTIFIFFAIKTLMDVRKSNFKEEELKSGSPILVAFSMFFLAELGDKTQIATLAKATTSIYPIMTLTGAVLGLVFSNTLGMLSGKLLTTKISQRYLQIASSVIFFIFGIYYLGKTLALIL